MSTLRPEDRQLVHMLRERYSPRSHVAHVQRGPRSSGAGKAAAEPSRRAAGRCVYCGGRAFGLTCPGHRDLPRLDPLYAQDLAVG
jgi:hypothetical protein